MTGQFYCQAKNTVLAAMFEPDVPVSKTGVDVVFDGTNILVSTKAAALTFGYDQMGIESAAQTVAFVMQDGATS